MFFFAVVVAHDGRLTTRHDFRLSFLIKIRKKIGYLVHTNEYIALVSEFIFALVFGSLYIFFFISLIISALLLSLLPTVSVTQMRGDVLTAGRLPLPHYSTGMALRCLLSLLYIKMHCCISVSSFCDLRACVSLE